VANDGNNQLSLIHLPREKKIFQMNPEELRLKMNETRTKKVPTKEKKNKKRCLKGTK
jgi:hypothetical protein